MMLIHEHTVPDVIKPHTDTYSRIYYEDFTFI